VFHSAQQTLSCDHILFCTAHVIVKHCVFSAYVHPHVCFPYFYRFVVTHRAALNVHATVHRYWILKHNQQDATLYNIFFLLSVLCMFRVVYPLIIRSSRTVHAPLGTSQSCLVRPLPTHVRGRTKQVWLVSDAARSVFELLTMSGKTARNTHSTDNSKEYCITLHLVGCA
jgi:hypothetical protein